MNPFILLGISSGIAAYKMLAVIQLLKKHGHQVRVILTENAAHMISVTRVEKVADRVYTNLFPPDFTYQNVLKKRTVEHIDLADHAKIFLIAPATANIIGKLAHGIADDLLTTTVLASRVPIVFCPSMNVHMLENPIVQDNVKRLKQSGYHMLAPEHGSLACGYIGDGRLPTPARIVSFLEHILQEKTQLRGQRILVTAGGTSEPIDAVRVITNRSSGKMGRAIAEACWKQGATVTLLRAVHAVSSSYLMEEKVFSTAQELEALMKQHASHADMIFHAAAVSDFRPTLSQKGKLKSTTTYTMHLTPTPKILSQIKQHNPRVILVGFKAVYKSSERELLQHARESIEKNNADFIVANDVGKKGIGFSADDNEVYVISKKGEWKKISKSSKEEIARRIIQHVVFARQEKSSV